MTDFDLSALVLGWIATYGSPMVAGLLLIGTLGVPLPCTLIVIASGAFIRQNLLDLYSTPVLGWIGAVLGDLSLYGVGFWAGHRINQRFGNTPAWQKARDLFDQRGGTAIFLTRWLITAVAFPISLIAGSSGYPFGLFVLLVVGGELLWVAIYGGLGYAFGSQWELISEFISNFSSFLFGALVLGLGIYLMIHFRKKNNKA
jgi:membrane protein DedA with SNARE-associated domain